MLIPLHFLLRSCLVQTQQKKTKLIINRSGEIGSWILHLWCASILSALALVKSSLNDLTWDKVRKRKGEGVTSYKQCFGIKSYQIYHIWSINQYQSITEIQWIFFCSLKNFCLCMHSRWSSILQGLVRIEFHGGNPSEKCTKCPDSQSPDRSPSISPRVQQHNFLPTCGTNVPHTTGGFGVRGMPWWSGNLHNLPQEQEPKLAKWLWLNWNQNKLLAAKCVPWISVLRKFGTQIAFCAKAITAAIIEVDGPDRCEKLFCWKKTWSSILVRQLQIHGFQWFQLYTVCGFPKMLGFPNNHSFSY